MSNETKYSMSLMYEEQLMQQVEIMYYSLFF